MQIDDISKGGEIELELKCSEQNMNFKSEVAFTINNSVLINTIKINEQTVGLSDKFMINFLYKTDNKLFLWENVRVTLVKYDGSVFHKVDLSGEGKPFNRREAYRMYIGEDMPVYINTASGPTALSVLVKDISVTGVGFIAKDDIDVNRTIRLKLKDNNNIISLSGVIVRKEFLKHLDSFLYGCKFNEKNNLLSKYITKRQAELLKKKNMNITPSNRQALKTGMKEKVM